MVYTILISVVFIAELIIAVTVFQNLLRLDRAVIEMDNNLTAKKSDIKDIAELMRKISEQWEVLAQDFVDKTKRDAEEVLLRNLSKMLVGLLVLNLNFKFVNKLRKSKVTKTLAKGLSFLENMV
jgi:hypothetical protein